jgi:hypothetical protein
MIVLLDHMNGNIFCDRYVVGSNPLTKKKAILFILHGIGKIDSHIPKFV